MPLKINTFPGRRILAGNKSYLYFGGTAYLGVQANPDFQSILIRNIQRYGSNYGASRLSNIQLALYDDAENQLGNWIGSESCISLSSGYLAGQLLAGYFDQNSYQTFYASNSHSSLYLGSEPIYSDIDSLRRALFEFLESKSDKIPILFTDSIEPGTSSYPEYSELRTLPLESCMLVVDDSHGIGILGSDGQGAFEILNQLNPRELVVSSSLGKALGLQAGAIFGTESLIERLKQTAMFAGASPTSPANLATLIEAMPLYTQKRKYLVKNIEHFINKLSRPELFDYIDSYPVFICKNPDLADYLFSRGICITHFHYKADNSFQSRIVLNAGHTISDIDQLSDLINEFHC